MFKHISIVFTIVILDFFSKLIVTNKLDYSQYIELIKFKFAGLNVFLNYNYGIAFGLFNNCNGYQNILFLFLNLLVIIFIIYFCTNQQLNYQEKLGILFILSGAIGNLIDRIIYGHVIDFIDFYIVINKNRLHWYTFNLADSVICLGTLLFLFNNFKDLKKIIKF